jgi:hypothetical protein
MSRVSPPWGRALEKCELCILVARGVVPEQIPGNRNLIQVRDVIGEPGWGRTSDLLIKSQLLYR